MSPTAKYINCDISAQIECCISIPSLFNTPHPTASPLLSASSAAFVRQAATHRYDAPTRCSPPRGSDCCGLCSYQTCSVLPRLAVFVLDRTAICTPISSFFDMSNSPPAYLFVVRQVDRPTDGRPLQSMAQRLASKENPQSHVKLKLELPLMLIS